MGLNAGDLQHFEHAPSIASRAVVSGNTFERIDGILA